MKDYIAMKIIPVIHHINQELTFKNADICAESGAFGVFLISMDGINEDLPTLAKKIKEQHPKLKVGFNLLGKNPLEAVKISIGYNLDMTWSDYNIVTSKRIHNQSQIISNIIKKSSHMFFNSVAFKYQPIEDNPGKAALLSTEFGFTPTTSGVSTGVAADISKIKSMKEAIGINPLAIASGLTPFNVMEYNNSIEFGLVSTGISKSFHELDEDLTKQIVQLTKPN